MLQDDPDAEAELQAMVEEELAGVGAARQALEMRLLHSLLPKDEAEDERRPCGGGRGGDGRRLRSGRGDDRDRVSGDGGVQASGGDKGG